MNKTKPMKTEFAPVVTTAKVDLNAESLFKTKGKDAKTLVDFLAAVDIDSKTPRVRMTPIICTIGAASRDVSVLAQMLEEGMNVARLNLSHGTHAFHAKTIENIRQAVDEHSRRIGVLYPLGIALDLKGPKIQTGYFEGGEDIEVELKKGSTVKLTTDKAYAEKCTPDHIYVDYHWITKVAKIGGKVYLDHGVIHMTIVDLGLSFLTCVVESGGILGGQRAVSLPGTTVDLPALTTKDRLDLLFAVEQQVDIIFAPYVRSASALSEIRYILGYKGRSVMIFSKIETYQGLLHLQEILQASNGIVLSRADLSTEVPPETVVTAQMTILARCNLASIATVCSTQVFESMLKKPFPTIAEVNDVGNAILNGADSFLLSGETETGPYPVESLRKLSAVCRAAEGALWSQQRYSEMAARADDTTIIDGMDVVAMATVRASVMCRAAAIITITKSGSSAHIISKYRPRCPIIAVTRYIDVARKHQVYRGIMPVVYTDKPNAEWPKDVDARVHFGMQFGLERGFIKIGDHVVIVSGWKKGSLFTNTMRVIFVSAERALQDAWEV